MHTLVLSKRLATLKGRDPCHGIRCVTGITPIMPYSMWQNMRLLAGAAMHSMQCRVSHCPGCGQHALCQSLAAKLAGKPPARHCLRLSGRAGLPSGSGAESGLVTL